MNWDWEKLKEHQKYKGGDSGGGRPPQVDEVLDKIKKIKLPGGPIVILILLALFLATSAYFTVATNEVGVIQRFGRFVRTVQPGFHFKWPAGIEKVTKVTVRKVETEEFGFRSIQSRRGATISTDTENNVALMLTGDLNVALVPWIVQYRIKDPYNYLFKVRDVKRLLRDMSEASMRMVVGDRSINEIISKRREVADEARKILQEEMDIAESGLEIITIEMKKTNVPGPVQPSFNEVNQAVQEKERLIYQAKKEYNKAIPTARGEAQRVIREAEGYALDKVNRAKGDATRFTALYKEYAKAKDITKRRLYLDAIRELFPKMGQKFIVDSNQQNLLPLLNLGKQTGIK
ncbi:MAG: FtsH protease activity modulator HflK [Deltaproteobacteria bacterium]|nr:MAG: FtsH protease activity modulator HflK [Deltaproteobacteria bacterium]RUA00936.1 MAG: FtsH protease activity modulator HflK [Deltaproteobacteria bacterium]